MSVMQEEAATVREPTLARRSEWIERLIHYNLLGILIILCVIATMLSDNFLTSRNLLNLLQQSAVLGIVSVGMTYVILTANIDLSVGSMAAFGGMLVAVLIDGGLNPLIAVVAAVAAGAAFGGGMGGLAAFVGVPSFMTSLAGLVGIRGLTYLLTDGVPIGNMPSSVTVLGSGRIGSVPIMGIIFVVIAIVGALALRYTVFGEYIYATGGNEEAARLSGVPTRWTITWAFVVSGALAAFAGVLLTARLTIGQPTAAQAMELDAIAAVVLGGTSLFGGRGTIFGTFVAVVLLGVLRNLFNLVGLSSFFQMTATGLILIVAIVLNKMIDRRQAGA